MSARPWLVLFLILNLGVAAWAVLHRDRAPMIGGARDGVPVLERVQPGATEHATAMPEPTVDGVADMSPQSPPTAHACGALGPFADAGAAQAARLALQARGVDAHARGVTSAAKGFNVFIAPQADAAAADALATRLKTAGFNDQFVIRTGALANGIALGKFGSEASAARLQATLQGAGFPAQVAPAGAVATAFWLDVTAVDAAGLASARRTAGAAQLRTASCGA